MKKEAVDLKLRVYRRTLDIIVLLWNNEQLTDDQRNNVIIFLKEADGSLKKVSFKIIDSIDFKEKNLIQDNIVVAGIPIKDNQLDPYKPYTFVIALGEVQTIESEIQVLGYGVLPTEEKDKKDAHAQIMGWDSEINKWVKVPLKKLKNGTYAVPVVLIEDK